MEVAQDPLSGPAALPAARAFSAPPMRIRFFGSALNQRETLSLAAPPETNNPSVRRECMGKLLLSRAAQTASRWKSRRTEERVLRYTSLPGSTSYTVDAAGNRTSKTALQQADPTPVSVTSNFSIDTNGTTLYTWDYENRLTSVTLPGQGGTVSFNYDPCGRRIRKMLSEEDSRGGVLRSGTTLQCNTVDACFFSKKFRAARRAEEPSAKAERHSALQIR